MKLLLSLTITCVLFPAGFPLRCYNCAPGTAGTCTTETTCQAAENRCGSIMVASYAGNTKITEMSVKSCGKSQECISGSINFGVARTTVNTECCSTDLCNSRNAAALAQSSANGKQCCGNDGCTTVINCLGDENSCIKYAATVGGVYTVMRGCASSSFCTSDQLSGALNMGVDVSMHCCQGNLCNDAQRIIQNILLLLVPLVSIVLIH